MNANHKIREPIVKEYAGIAPVYDTRWSFYVDATVRETMARLSLVPAARVLDVGCGTGALLQALADKYPESELAGIDPVPEMLAVGRRRLPREIKLYGGWAEELPFEDQSFDVVVSCSMFHFIRQPRIALEEMRRILQPGGQLVITDWCGDYLTCRILDRYLYCFNAAHYRVYRQHELIQLLKETGYSQVHAERYKINWLWGLMTVQATVPG
jgi:ubiquinone/menaquinone biosynthesis C-methylase UbiE